MVTLDDIELSIDCSGPVHRYYPEDVHAAIERSSVTNGLAAIILSAYDLWNRGKRGAALRGDGSYGDA